MNYNRIYCYQNWNALNWNKYLHVIRILLLQSNFANEKNK